MYISITEDELKEKYCEQFDDTDPKQYAYFYGMHLYEIAERYDLIDVDVAKEVIHWLSRYISQDDVKPDCAKQSRYIVAKLFNQFPELRKELK